MRGKKLIAAIMSACMLFPVLSGCSSKGSEPAAAGQDKQVTITYGLWDKNQEPVLRKIADKFESANPNIKVKIELTPWDQYWTKLETAATGGALPDVFWLNGNNITKYAVNNMILPLDDNIKKDNVDLAKFPQSLVDLYSVKGKKYGMPKDWDTIGLWYNKELFDAKNIPYPDNSWDFNKVREVAKQLTDKSKGIYGIAAQNGNQENYYNTIFQNGGAVLSADKKTSEFNKPETIQGIQVWVDLINDGSSPTLAQLTETDQNSLFESGKVAMIYAGSWMLPQYAANENIKDKFDIAEMPKIKKQATVIHGLGNVISAKSKNPDAAWKFVKYLSEKEANDDVAKSGIVIPAYNDSLQIYLDSNKKYNVKAFTNALQYSVMMPVSLDSAKWEEIESENIKKAWTGELSVEEACNIIAGETTKILQAEK